MMGAVQQAAEGGGRGHPVVVGLRRRASWQDQRRPQLSGHPLGGAKAELVNELVAVDSNALTYLVEAVQPRYDPTRDPPALAAERVAMIRAYLYGGVQFWVMPTVEAEYNKIRDPSRHLRHQRAAWILLHDAPIEAPSNALDARASQLAFHDPGASDCRIVAEAETSGVPSLLTRDEALIANLQPHSKLLLQYPSQFWASLRISPGSTPVLEPHPTNPLAHAVWWRL
jgi:hypothetical protein